jgi:hypothetical protein
MSRTEEVADMFSFIHTGIRHKVGHLMYLPNFFKKLRQKTKIKYENSPPPPRFSHNPKYPPQNNFPKNLKDPPSRFEVI